MASCLKRHDVGERRHSDVDYDGMTSIRRGVVALATSITRINIVVAYGMTFRGTASWRYDAMASKHDDFRTPPGVCHHYVTTPSIASLLHDVVDGV